MGRDVRGGNARRLYTVLETRGHVMTSTTLSTLHNISFARDPMHRSPDTIARCTCSWSMRGTRAEVMNRAAVHDLDQWDVEEKPVG